MSQPLFFCFAPCPRGLEGLLVQELETLPLAGLGQVLKVTPAPGGVSFQADWAGIMQANLWSRCASRILLRLDKKSYRNEQDIYDIALAQPWTDWFDLANDFKVDLTALTGRRAAPTEGTRTKQPPPAGKRTKPASVSHLQSLDFVTLRVKDAVCDHFRERTGQRPDINTQHPDIRIHVFLDDISCTLYLDTSGDALFKRGWRLEKGEAPIRENLAAGLLQLANWPERAAAGLTLLDPFCGSGTLLVEAMLQQLQVAPGLARSFAFECLRPCPLEQWQQVKQQARQQIQLQPLNQIHGSDIDQKMVYRARRNIERAAILYGLPENLPLPTVAMSSADEKAPPAPQGLIICNPPYGERMQVQANRDSVHPAPEETDALFSHWATQLKRHYAGWSVYVISADMQLPKRLRLKESQRLPLFNGPLECRYFRFDMVSGSARHKPSQDSANPGMTPA
ncbi:THUMP domain-containing class I SAM-dependent RNA methyltransferase [Parvibium lacunae]|uniref:Class I SAM-dependent RNA methyltransferase n=1 Tax=Parvibium lacunae TaxID=1888893 RepID=A0A368L3X2_9BURK|nr:class I SAM-dependent RNA methyltransferase [Parvibium lacunae]RCS58269.1 class I SAM-dependent RNA methyltransferase [Parvibium lacunae]